MNCLLRIRILVASLVLAVLASNSLVMAQQKSAKKAAKKARAANPSLEQIQDQPGLPRVLLIGDSISIGYTVSVREMLKGEANVHRIPVNGGPTTNGLRNLTSWLGDSKWDVIHFNWGLHDLKYVGPDGTSLVDPKSPGAHPQVPLPEYEENLRKLVDQLRKTGARLIWCNTTPVPAGASGRVPGDEQKYNEAAARVMQGAGVTTNDLHRHAQAKLKDVQRPENVHFTDEGSKYLAEQVVTAIRQALAKK
ncbi:MAG: SGNH/GDSL hydrolase family protein [Pirellulaceae bacterium]